MAIKTDNPLADEPNNGHVFVSYARKDQEFVDDLVAALERHEGTTWLDRERIPDATKWMEQIRFAIVDARACVFVISEHAVDSEIWNAELSEGLKHGKRLLPVIIDDVCATRVPSVLRDLQWVNFRDRSHFDESVRLLVVAIRQNPEWLLAHSRFAIKAAEWNRADSKSGAVLRGPQLKEAAAWLDGPDRLPKDPSLTADQIGYIRASIVARKRRRIGVTIGVAFALVLGVVSVQQYQRAALRQQIVAAQGIAAAADRAFGETAQDLQRSTLLAAKSLSITTTEEGRRRMLQNLALLPQASSLLGRFDEAVLSLAFSPDGKQLAVGTQSKGVALCNVENRDCQQTLNIPGYVRHIKFSDNSRSVFIAGADVAIWELSHLDQPSIRAGDGDAQAYAVSTDFKYIAYGDQHGAGAIHNVTTGERTGIYLSAGFASLAFNNDVTLLASGDTTGTIQVWKVAGGGAPICGDKQQLAQWSHGQRINALTFLPRDLFDNALAAGSGAPTGRQPDNSTHIWRMCDRTPAKTIRHENPVRSIVFADDGKLFASQSDQRVILAEYEPNLRGSPTQWNVGTIALQAKALVHAVAFVPGTRRVVTAWSHRKGKRTGTVLISREAQQADPPGGPAIRELQRLALDTAPQSLAFSRDGRYLVTGEKNGVVRLWLLNQGSNSTVQSDAELMTEACRRLPSAARRSIVSSRQWALSFGDQPDRNDPCDGDSLTLGPVNSLERISVSPSMQTAPRKSDLGAIATYASW